MKKHTQTQRVRHAIAAAVLLTSAACASPQSGPSIPPVSAGVIPSSSFDSNAGAPKKGVLVQRYIQFANATNRTIYPQLTQPNGWVTDRMPRPIPPGGRDLPIILGCDANGAVADYEILYGPANPPTTGAVFKAHFNPGARDPFAFELDGGDGLQMSLSDTTTYGGIHIKVITVGPAIAKL